MLKHIKWAIIILVFSIIHVHAANDQITLEENLTNLGQRTLDYMFGEGNFIIKVDVSMTAPSYSVKYTQQSTPKGSKKQEKSEQVYILPGVPALKNISPDNLKTLPYDSVTTVTESKLKKMNVYIMANKDIPKSEARKAEPAVKEVLGFVDGRDTFRTEYKPFFYNPNKTTQNITIVPGKEKILSVQNGFYLALLLLLLAFIALYIYYQRTQKESLGNQSSVNISPKLEVSRDRDQQQSAAPGESSKNSIKRFFDFVEDDTIEDFVSLLKKEALALDHLALVISFLAPQYGAQVLEALSNEEKSEIAVLMIDQKIANRQFLEKLEAKLKFSLENISGGEQRFQRLFERVSQKEKEIILKTLKTKKSPGYKKVRNNVIVFDDLKYLSTEELHLILSNTNVDLIAQSLVNTDQVLYDTIFNSLTKNASSMVQQYLELKNVSSSKKDIEFAQNYIIKIAETLDKSGKISLKDKLKG